jgi:hypothetical protein
MGIYKIYGVKTGFTGYGGYKIFGENVFVHMNFKDTNSIIVLVEALAIRNCSFNRY